MNKQRLSLEKKLHLMESRLTTCGNTDKNSIFSSINNAKRELDQYVQTSAIGAAVRSRARWVEFGEKNCQYFLGLEKRNQLKNCIKSVKASQGTSISEQHNISQHLANYYKSLYEVHAQFTENECFNLVNRLSVPTIKEIDKN